MRAVKGPAVYVAASLAAGLLNYLYQVHAAAALDAAAFGRLSAWLAGITIALSLSTVAQFVGIDLTASARSFARALRAGALVGAVAAIVAVFVGDAPIVLGVVAVGVAVALQWTIGQLQGRLRFVAAAAGVTMSAAARVGYPFRASTDVHAYFVAQALAPCAGVLACTTLAMAGGRDAEEEAASAKRPPLDATKLGRPLLLGLAAVLFPSMDVLAVSYATDETTTGQLARVTLASRFVFFAGAAGLQALLPYQIRAIERGEAPPRSMALLERLALPAAFLGAASVGIAADVLVFHGAHRSWLVLSCVAAAALVGVTAELQRLAARGRIRAAGLAVAAAALASAGSALACHGDVTRYLMVASACDLAVLVFAIAARRA